MKILLDTNIILDYALQREGFWKEAEAVFRLTETGKKHRICIIVCCNGYFLYAKEILWR